MKVIINLSLSSAFRAAAIDFANTNNADITIHEYFRDHFVYANFKTVNIQQDGYTGVYTLTVQPSVKDAAPLTTLVYRFCKQMSAHGIQVDGYVPEPVAPAKVFSLTMRSDLDDHTYTVTIDDNSEPACECSTFDEMEQWIDGFKQAANHINAFVQVIDLTE